MSSVIMLNQMNRLSQSNKRSAPANARATQRHVSNVPVLPEQRKKTSKKLFIGAATALVALIITFVTAVPGSK